MFAEEEAVCDEIVCALFQEPALKVPRGLVGR
jgi:hypothetical protein